MLRLAPELEDLPEGPLSADLCRPDGTLVLSLTAHAIAAAERHKWIESEKARRDLGEPSLGDWVDRFWTGYVRARLMEHLYGWRWWGAFDAELFGLLSHITVQRNLPCVVLQEIALQLREGAENLDIIAWATEVGHNLDAVIWLLERIDINAVRNRLLNDHVRLFIDHR